MNRNELIENVAKVIRRNVACHPDCQEENAKPARATGPATD